MKKIFILLLIVFSVPSFGQKYLRLTRASVTGTDTTIYVVNSHRLLTVDFTATNGNTSTLDMGPTDNTVSFVSATVPSDITFPVTLSKVTYTKASNGYTRNRIAFDCTDMAGKLIGLKFTFTGVTAPSFYDIWY